MVILLAGPDQGGYEPAISGMAYTRISGQEPMLGGERLIALYRKHLLFELEKSTITHQRRMSIGRWLAEFGDDRPGTGLRPDGLPDLVWCAVWSGRTLVHDRTGLASRYEVGRFYIARYPVTWAQYRIFLKAGDGHANPRWWEGLLRRQEYKREVLPVDNHPAQEVSWYDAVAYCRWLSEKIGYTVRLPTEWEWQHAATGGDPNLYYPWGRAWDRTRANTRESALRGVTAVGMYPAAVSPVGTFDMCGTVLEWCANAFADPNDLSTRRIERVMRGGSWFSVRNYAHSMFRTGYDPYYRYNSVGFRLAADAPLLDDNLTQPAVVEEAPAFLPDAPPDDEAG